MAIDFESCKHSVRGARVLVTGGAGFIGSHLVDRLLEYGAERVVVIDDLSRARPGWYPSRLDHPRLEFVIQDLLERNGVSAWFEHLDVVYHLAAVAQVMGALRNPERTFSVNVLGTMRVARLARRAGVPRLVFTSSREVYGDPAALPVKEDAPLQPKNLYGASKLAAEAFLRALQDPSPSPVSRPPSSSPSSVLLRLANVYGPGDTDRVIPIFIANALQGVPLTVFGPDKRLDLIWIGDVINVLIQAGFGSPAVPVPVNVGSGTATGLEALAYQIKALTRSSSPVNVIAPRAPEVDRFQADLARAQRYFGLKVNPQPLRNLESVVEAARQVPVEARSLFPVPVH
jgi:UDP-glucose 4-epimerase